MQGSGNFTDILTIQLSGVQVSIIPISWDPEPAFLDLKIRHFKLLLKFKNRIHIIFVSIIIFQHEKILVNVVHKGQKEESKLLVLDLLQVDFSRSARVRAQL